MIAVFHGSTGCGVYAVNAAAVKKLRLDERRNRMTQTQQIHNMLKKGPVTPLDALKIGCFRLSARIYDLRREGVKISSKPVQGKKTDVWYSEYRLIK